MCVTNIQMEEWRETGWATRGRQRVCIACGVHEYVLGKLNEMERLVRGMCVCVCVCAVDIVKSSVSAHTPNITALQILTDTHSRTHNK